jgi:hypothetical protein
LGKGGSGEENLIGLLQMLLQVAPTRKAVEGLGSRGKEFSTGMRIRTVTERFSWHWEDTWIT